MTRPGPSRPTLRDVAALAGVSHKTASRVLNGEPNVVPGKVVAVHRAVQQLGYRRDPQASGLRRSDRRTSALAALLEDLANPFSAEVHRALADVAREHGSVVLSGSVDEDPGRERELVRIFTDRRVDALVVAPASDHQGYLEREIDPTTPVVFVDRAPRGFAADAVVTDNAQASEAAVAHLRGMGHRRIAFLGDLQSITTAAERHLGYRTGMERGGLAVDARLVVLDLHDTASAEAAVSRLLDLAEPPTALYTAQNNVTIAAIRVLQRRGLSERVALVGFDDFPLADLLRPGVTVIAQAPYEIGRRAAETAFARLAGDVGPPTVHVVSSRLVRRGSGEIACP